MQDTEKPGLDQQNMAKFAPDSSFMMQFEDKKQMASSKDVVTAIGFGIHAVMEDSEEGALRFNTVEVCHAVSLLHMVAARVLTFVFARTAHQKDWTSRLYAEVVRDQGARVPPLQDSLTNGKPWFLLSGILYAVQYGILYS